MVSDVEINMTKLLKDFEKRENITEIIHLKSIVQRKRNMIDAESNNFMQRREKVLASLERNMFHQEMKMMSLILTESYGRYWDEGEYYIHHTHLNKIIKDNGRHLCLISSQGLHLTLSSLKE